MCIRPDDAVLHLAISCLGPDVRTLNHLIYMNHHAATRELGEQSSTWQQGRQSRRRLFVKPKGAARPQHMQNAALTAAARAVLFELCRLAGSSSGEANTLKPLSRLLHASDSHSPRIGPRPSPPTHPSDPQAPTPTLH